MTQRTTPQQRAAQPADPQATSKGFHARLRELDTLYVRYYPALATAFEPYAEAGKSEALSDGTRTKGSTFDPDAAALMLVRVIDLAGLSTRSDIEHADEFEKGDAEFALELGISLHRFRAARRFLACDVNLVGRRDVRLPNRTFYRPIWPRIQQFFFGTDAGMGWGQMPLVGVSRSAGAPRSVGTDPPKSSTGDEKANSGTRKSQPGVTKNPTRGCEKANPFRKDLYREDCTDETQKDVVVVESAATTAWISVMGTLLKNKIGIEPPICYELADQLAGVWSDSGRKPHEIALRIDAALTSLQGIQAITNPTGKLIADIRRDPLLTGKRYEVETG